MNTSDKNNTDSHHKESKILTGLFQQSHNDIPPSEIDKAILAHAKNSSQGKKVSSDVVQKSRNWRPIMAAASLVLALPLVWLLTQNQALTESEAVLLPNAKMKPADLKFQNHPESPDSGVTIETELILLPATKPNKHMINQSLPATSVIDMQEIIEERGRLSITGDVIDRASLAANKEQLMNELKAKKRTIKPSTIGPLMALEFEQFGRYLDLSEFEKADQLLTEMQEKWPEYDYEEMIYRLALAEIN